MSTQANTAADISNPQVGQQIYCPFVVGRIEVREAKNGKKFWNVTLRNETGEINSRVWQEKFELWEGVEPGSPIMLTGRIENGFPEGTLDLVAQAVELIEAPHPVQNYLNPVYPGDIEALKAEFEEMRGRIQHPGYRLFFDRFFETVCPKERFFTCPAARNNHHAYIGGLLEHSLEVTRLWLSFAEQPALEGIVSRDLGIVGALIHDAGKIHEYVWEGVPIDNHPDALLYGHITMGPLMIQKVMESARDELKAAGFTQRDAKFLIHMVVSHHGKGEWGSPSTPAMVEAELLHQADNMSAKVRAIAQIARDHQPDRYGKIESGNWGPYKKGIIAGPAYWEQVRAQQAEELVSEPANVVIQPAEAGAAEEPSEQLPLSPAQALVGEDEEAVVDEAEQVLASLPGLYEGSIGENLQQRTASAERRTAARRR